MVFSSVEFIFMFLPVVLAAYYIVPKRLRSLRNLALLLFSLLFYAYAEPKALLIMLVSILVNYLFGLLINKNKGIKSTAYLITAILINFGLLGYFKYLNFFIDNVGNLTGLKFAAAQIVLPIGISFYTFQGVSYIIDVYRDKTRQTVQKNPLNVALYIALFPQLIAGPIIRYSTFAPQIRGRKETVSDFAEGVTRFVIGLGKKVLIANNVGKISAAVFALEPSSNLTFKLAWVGAIAYTLQIYYDFSGYSDIAIGLGKMLGFSFPENFNYPYISRSITEFWRRWHISLGAWFRDYLYIPLGGNRGGAARHIRNILIVWLLTGFWHGAAWNFCAWGLYFAVLLIIEKYLFKNIWSLIVKNTPGTTVRVLSAMLYPIRHLYSLLFIIIGWVLFEASTLQNAATMLRTMFGLHDSGIALFNNEAAYLITEYKLFLIVGIIAALPITSIIKNWLIKKDNAIVNLAAYNLKSVYIIAIFVLSIVSIISSSFNPFIYFRF